MISTTHVNQYIPSVVFPPGETIKELLEDFDITQVELATRAGKSEKFISQLVNGKVALSEETAIILERVFNVKADFWLRLESNYQLFLVKEKEKYNKCGDWIRQKEHKQTTT